MSRYYVIEIQGWSIPTKRQTLGTSYSVLDSAENHREVFGQYQGHMAPWGGVRDPLRRKRMAQRECERLNQLDAEPTA